VKILLLHILCYIAISCTSKESAEELYDDMVKVPSGEFEFGKHEGKEEESPAVHVHMSSFYIDKHEVTNEDFQAFVDAEGYITTAEKNGASSIYTNKWQIKEDINWRSDSDTLEDFENLPVVHLSWTDANAYCQWKKKRLLSEMEFEYVLEKYGGGEYNIWEGEFPNQNTREDGYKNRAPVMSFSPNKIGVYDLQGNVWEWTADHYHHNVHDILKIKNPDSALVWEGAFYNPANLNAEEMVIKGGSFLCHDSYCKGYMSNARMPAEKEMSYYHLGFRCGCDL
jgi:sulfatase modifying factor 1